MINKANDLTEEKQMIIPNKSGKKKPVLNIRTGFVEC